MKKFLFFFVLYSILTFNIDAENSSYYDRFTSYKLFINTGINYHFPFNTDFTTQEYAVSFDVPLNINIDIRKSKYVSFYTGIEFSYCINFQSLLIDEEKFSFYFNSLFIRLPFVAKFYFMYDKDPAFENFYLELGGFLHLWALNTYYVSVDGEVHSGNSYNPLHSESLPGNIFTPVNIGIKFGIGNNFYVSKKILFGLELFTTYLAIPQVNGYYYGTNYKRKDYVIMEFDLSVGACISIGIDLME